MAGLVVVTAGCRSSSTAVDVEDREPLPPVEQLAFDTVEPAQAWDYWELRWMLHPSADSIVGSGGPVPRAQLLPKVREALDALAPETGFAQGCLPGHGFNWDDGHHTGWRSVPGGWELVVLELVSACAPVQTDRVRLHVHASGTLNERAREVWKRLEGACI